MGAFLSLTVTHDDGREVNVDVRPVTIVAFERQYGTGIAAVSESPHLEYIYWLGWHSEKIAKLIVKPFDEWLEDVTDVSVQADKKVDAPLETTPSPVASLGSPSIPA